MQQLKFCFLFIPLEFFYMTSWILSRRLGIQALKKPGRPRRHDQKSEK
jgi:hypothetical protein